MSFGRAYTLSQTQTRFILLLPQAAALPRSDAGSNGVKSALSFAIQSCQTLCFMSCAIYEACCYAIAYCLLNGAALTVSSRSNTPSVHGQMELHNTSL